MDKFLRVLASTARTMLTQHSGSNREDQVKAVGELLNIAEVTENINKLDVPQDLLIVLANSPAVEKKEVYFVSQNFNFILSILLATLAIKHTDGTFLSGFNDRSDAPASLAPELHYSGLTIIRFLCLALISNPNIVGPLFGLAFLNRVLCRTPSWVEDLYVDVIERFSSDISSWTNLPAIPIIRRTRNENVPID